MDTRAGLQALRQRRGLGRAQHGLSMVELLVGVAIALFIAATGATLLAGNLRESRNLLLEARLLQDLRTAADVITRDLRRAGYWGAATEGVWTAGAAAVIANPYVALAPGGAASDAVSFQYSRDAAENNAVDTNEQFGFRLRNRVIEMQLGAGNWQALTDAGTLDVTEFSVTPTVQEIDLRSYCTQPCPAGSATCPPRQQVRSLALVVTGRSTTDASVVRSLRSNVRLRNDAVSGACPA
jgi:prepilin peptidase dependent protein B